MVTNETYQPESRQSAHSVCWIFQVNPNIYDLDAALKKRDRIAWQVTRYKAQIKNGDRAYIWRSGKDGGLVASADIMTPPQLIHNDSAGDKEFYLNQEEFSETLFGVELQIREKFDSPIGRQIFEHNKILRNSLIIRQPNATNYPITPQELEVIESLVNQHRDGVDLTPKIESTGWWWVNQGSSYRTAKDGGYLWAPVSGKGGRTFAHHQNMTKLRAGDIVFNFSDRHIRAVSLVESAATEATIPEELAHGNWQEKGYLAKVTYHELEQPIPAEQIPFSWRKNEGGPFNKLGGVNQGYLFPISLEFAAGFSPRFRNMLPAFVVEAADQLEVDTTQPDAFDELADAIRNLRVSMDAGRPRLYKPAILDVIFDALDDGELTDNSIYFDWLMPRFLRRMQELGSTAGETQAGYAYFHLSSEPFWRIDYKDPKSVLQEGEPAAIRRLVNYASFVEPYWAVLHDPRQRARLRDVLHSTWFAGYEDSAGAVDSVASPAPDYDAASSVERLMADVSSMGFFMEPWQLACFVTAARTKPFIILAGVSGTGKSKLPALVAKATGGAHRTIPVRPDWTDSSEVLGYYDLSGKFREGHLLTLIDEARKQPETMFFAIMDEMNLARVELYFAEVLSQMENREPAKNGGFESGELIAVAGRAPYTLPNNLCIVGTVNMDETTHGFSKKVLDRAFTMELSDVNLKTWDIASAKERVTTKRWPLAAWAGEATRLGDLKIVDDADYKLINEVVDALVEINQFLSNCQLQVGYRVRDEICLFVKHAQRILGSFRTSDGETVDPLDLAINMKILPRLAGASSSLRTTLYSLLGWANVGQPYSTESEANAVKIDWIDRGRPASLSDAEYPRTAARLCLMLERLQTERFTSYWL